MLRRPGPDDVADGRRAGRTARLARHQHVLTAFPQRLAVMFMGNGINGNHWWAKGQGANIKLSKSLEPLEPIKQKINVIHGLFHKRAMGNGIHPAQTGGLLSGSVIQKGAIVRAGITVDQLIANRVGQDTPLPSIVLACEERDVA